MHVPCPSSDINHLRIYLQLVQQVVTLRVEYIIMYEQLEIQML
jgi:hypothetical protein